jgi:PIN domain nuclease of toxin-antitoxin system
VTGLTLDAGALIAVERGNENVLALLERVLDHQDAVINVPGGALAQALRNPARQARLMRLLGRRQVRVASLDAVTAYAVGMMLALRDASDVVDASVVICARRYHQPIVTSDVDDLRRLDEAVELFAV